MAVKDAHFNDGPLNAGWHFQGGVADVRGFFTKDCAQELFFWRHRGLTLGRDFADQNIARVYFSTNGHNARFIQIAQAFFANVWNIARDFFRAQFGIAG